MRENIDPAHRVDGRWIYASVDDITKPKSGRICYGPRWWAVTDLNEVMFFDRYSSPQCNQNKSIVERLGNGFNAPLTRPVFLEIAFVPHRCES